MYLDFDRFKLVNDTLGHSAGDQFLIDRCAAHRAPGAAGRHRRAPGRRRIRDPDRARPVARHGAWRWPSGCSRRCASAFQVDGTEVNTSASIGITFSSVGYETPDEVLRDADIAMYRAKSSGRARHALFDTALRVATVRPGAAGSRPAQPPSSTTRSRWPSSRSSTRAGASSASRRWHAGHMPSADR